MRSKKVWRYYCDYCKKNGCNCGCIKKHEAGCCHNPNRVCGMCQTAEFEQKPMAELISALTGDGLKALISLAEGCPACILAAIIQSSDGDKDLMYSYEWSYKAAHDKFWCETNDRNTKADYFGVDL